MSGQKPDLVVYGLALDGEHFKRIGVAWTKSKRGVKYISIALDFKPNTSDLYIWPAGDKPDLSEEEARAATGDDVPF